jgi:hypothetical protein
VEKGSREMNKNAVKSEENVPKFKKYPICGSGFGTFGCCCCCKAKPNDFQ